MENSGKMPPEVRANVMKMVEKVRELDVIMTQEFKELNDGLDAFKKEIILMLAENYQQEAKNSEQTK